MPLSKKTANISEPRNKRAKLERGKKNAKAPEVESMKENEPETVSMDTTPASTLETFT